MSQKWFSEREIIQQRCDFFYCCLNVRTSGFLCRLALKKLPHDKIFLRSLKGLTEGTLQSQNVQNIPGSCVLIFCSYILSQSVTFGYLNHIDIFAGGFGRVLIGVQY